MKVLIFLLLALVSVHAANYSYRLQGRSLQDAGSEVEIQPDLADGSDNAALTPPDDNSNNPTADGPPQGAQAPGPDGPGPRQRP